MKKYINIIKTNRILFTSTLISVIGISLMIYFACIKSFNDYSFQINPDLASQYGTFISGLVGPIFTLVGFLLIYETIKRQREDFDKQQFENRFFEMVRYYRENVATMEFKTPFSKVNEMTTGRQVFVELKKQSKVLIEEISKYISKKENQSDKEYQEFILKISFLIIYYGVGETTKQTLLDKLKIIIPNKAVNLIEELRKKKTKYNEKIVFYGGHQSKLGFYFRHLYQTVKFVDNNNTLSEDEKIAYIEILVSQLTNYEQAILFFYSMSPFGKEWRDNKYILKYKMIKNLPHHFLGDINFNEFYDIEYEYDEL
jgi:hypothetical protein